MPYELPMPVMFLARAIRRQVVCSWFSNAKVFARGTIMSTRQQAPSLVRLAKAAGNNNLVFFPRKQGMMKMSLTTAKISF